MTGKRLAIKKGRLADFLEPAEKDEVGALCEKLIKEAGPAGLLLLASSDFAADVMRTPILMRLSESSNSGVKMALQMNETAQQKIHKAGKDKRSGIEKSLRKPPTDADISSD
jgi:hypothetical protein